MKKYGLNDVKVNVRTTDETYYEYIAKFDNGWCELRGYYDGEEVFADELIIGHSGYGRQASRKELNECFNQLKGIILKKIEYEIDNGFVENTLEEAMAFIDDNYAEIEACDANPDRMFGLVLDYC